MFWERDKGIGIAKREYARETDAPEQIDQLLAQIVYNGIF